MYEVEVKVPADHAEVRERLDALGADPVNAVEQEDTYYDAPHREFAETDEALRVRRESPEDADSFAELTYKGPLVEAESKTRREVETEVAEGEAAGDILAALGFDPAATVRKERERFALDGYTVTLDAVNGLGEFVEIETEVADEDAVEAAREEAFEILRELELDPEDQIRTSYLGLLLEAESEP
ncbi:class IV adenylate cyclase [Halorussus gelatinilyticus]|uniref:Class IV adenylate cyclase n=1 Tax=Halorussus gelatinilyticus TaxID=2937524 RepID=A0A8U0IGW9_9EURY|nr:class IV adenylate cyclase [Halorussus gelatinilyticus]UPW00340.1 class IV adenylate cyclase [Halorussus gelatinilyticus]